MTLEININTKGKRNKIGLILSSAGGLSLIIGIPISIWVSDNIGLLMMTLGILSIIIGSRIKEEDE